MSERMKITKLSDTIYLLNDNEFALITKDMINFYDMNLTRS